MKLQRLVRYSFSISLYSTSSLLSSFTRIAATTTHNRSLSSFVYQAPYQRLFLQSFNRSFSMELQREGETAITKILKDPIFLQEKRKWGFVVVRGTYDDDTAWKNAMTQISDHVSHYMDKFEKEQNIDVLHTQTILEDPSIFTDADKASLRPHFANWVHADLASSIDTSILDSRYDITPPLSLTDPVLTSSILGSTRHAYFLYINHRCLNSFATSSPIVILIQKDYEAPGTPDFGDDYDPIESNPHYDVGWCYTPLNCYMEWYRNLADASDEWWELRYERPPWVSDSLRMPQDTPFGPELNAQGTGPARRGE